MNFSVKSFKVISILEALSFLILLCIAMPLKYIWDMPKMVQVIGMVHGILFILYVIGAYFMYQKLNWELKTLFVVMVCSVLPFGPFYTERKYL
ncbi:MAG: DUF3817 domain-containing protein [Flavobacteriaceae bacterium]|nr:DUF3817 domain-containing protein [Flavobacteriaceae bacterium]